MTTFKSAIEIAKDSEVSLDLLYDRLQGFRESNPDDCEKIESAGRGPKWRYRVSALASTLAELQAVRDSDESPQHWRSDEIKSNWDLPDEIEVGGKIYYHARKATAISKWSSHTWRNWSNNGCPHLGDKPIGSHDRVCGFGRTCRYYLKSDVHEAMDKHAAITPTPKDDKYIPLDVAARRCRLTVPALLKRRPRTIRRPGKRTNGRPIMRTLVLLEDVEAIRADKQKRLPTGRISTAEAATRLDTTGSTIVRWCREGCDWIGGNTLDFIEGSFQSKEGPVRGLFPLASQITQIQKAMKEPFVYRDAAGDWLPIVDAAKKFKLSVQTLKSAQRTGGIVSTVKPCPMWRSHRGALIVLWEPSVKAYAKKETQPALTPAPSPAEPVPVDPAPPAKKKKKRGRKKGWRDPEVVAAEQKLISYWEEHKETKSRSRCCKDLDFDPSNGAKVINRHEAEKRGK